ncbi:MAG: sulfotransferase [Acidimicrobiales bacterium]
MQKATVVAGVEAWPDRGYLPALELLVGSCRATAALHEQGRAVLESIVVRHLVNRLLVDDEVARQPTLAAAAVGPAIVVTGLPRTGTTLLHNLLALDPSFRPLRLWEALQPVPRRRPEVPSREQRVAQAARWLERLYQVVPGFQAIHATTPEGPEECDALLQNDFASQHFDDMFNAEAYSAWLATAPLDREYRSYARQLCVLRRPEDGARPWVLKSPSHLGHLDALLAACPEATVIHCHRAPAQAVPSYASLVLSLRRAYSDDVSAALVGEQALRRTVTALARAGDVRRGAPGRFLDVSYGDLVTRPRATVATLYEQLGRPLPDEVGTAIDGWLGRHPQHEHGVHRYGPGDFGLGAAALDEAFASYREEHAASLG